MSFGRLTIRQFWNVLMLVISTLRAVIAQTGQPAAPLNWPMT